MGPEGQNRHDHVLHRALSVLHEPDICGYWHEDVSDAVGLPGSIGDISTVGSDGLHLVHTVVALPPSPFQLHHTHKNMALTLPEKHYLRDLHEGDGGKRNYRELFLSVLGMMQSSILGELSDMSSAEYARYIEYLASLRQEDPVAIYAVLASDDDGTGVLQPDTVRVYVPEGYSLALAMRDIATAHGFSICLN